MVGCPRCEGRGWELDVHLSRGPDGPIMFEREMTCVECDGIGELNIGEKQEEK